MDDLVIELSDTADPAPPSPRPSRKSLSNWLAVGVVAVSLIAWLATRPGSAGGPTGGDAPTELAAADLPAGLSLGTLVIPTRPTRLVQTGSHRGQRSIDGLVRSAGTTYSAAELGGGGFLVTAQPQGELSRLYTVSATTGRATPIISGFVEAPWDRVVGTSAVPGADGASVLLVLGLADRSQLVVRLDFVGESVGDDIVTPAGRELVGDSVAGLVYETGTGTEHMSVEVVDGGTLRYSSDGPAVAAGRTTLALWRPGEDLVVVDLHDRAPYATERRVSGVVEGSIGTAQFSRDGRYLAIDAVDDGNAHTVSVLDLATDRWLRLPGTPVRADELHMLWNSEAGVLAVTTGARDTVLWRPGDPVAYSAAS